MTDEQKIKQLQKFQKDFQKLMDKYPEIQVFGNMNGDVNGYMSLAFPNVRNKHGNIRLTYQGKAL